MQLERWRQIDEIFHSALNIEESRRAAFLDDTCSGDVGLRLELQALLARHEEARTFLESPALEMAAEELVHAGCVSSESGESVAAALVGETISHYRILSKLGSGGMGVIYEAEDIRLGRRVALKFLSEDVARDPKALQRFKGEARAASCLNHPNICTIYEVEEHNGQPVIVMELLEGESLKQRIRAGPIPVDRLLRFGIQASDGLHAAHAKGIIHRDIKPANIFMVGDGQVKILDFGVAKVILAPEAEGRTGEESLTLKGAILGTTSYMSPEQARGEEIDARSDLFSLGVVLYELGTGHQPFARKNPTLTIDAILNVRPDAPSSLNPALPAAVDTIIARMLEKDRELRYQRAADICSDLKRLKEGNQTEQTTLGGGAAEASAQRRTVRSWGLAVAACFGGIAIAGGAFFYFHRAPALTEKDTMVLADFKNTTGDPVFDGTLRQGLAVQLEQSPFLSLTSEARIQQTLRLMSRPADARLTPELAQEVCERTGSAAVLEGSIASLGNQYVLALRAKNCHTGDVLDEEQVQAARKEDVLNALSQIASTFRTRVGESLSTVEKHSTPLAEATTPSLEALKAYSTGVRIAFSNGLVSALPHFQRATEIDPKFAMAYAHLGLTYSAIGESVLSMRSTSNAYQLRERATDREKFFIVVNYDRSVTRNLEKAQQTCELWAQTYPRDTNPHALSSGFIYQGSGKYKESIEGAKQAIALDPDFTFAYVNLAYSYFYLDRLREAEDTIQRASARKLEIPEFLVLRYYIAFLRGDKAGMDREVALSQRESGAEDWIAHSEALGLARSGQLQLARSLSRHAVDLAQQAGNRERAATYEAGVAVWNAFFGNTPEARQSAMAALKPSKGRDVEYAAAFALALSGDSSGSQALADDLERRFPEDTSVRFSYLPALRARLALNHGDPAKAIELLQIAAPYELAVPGIDFFGFFGGLYPAYVRGEAYLAAHQGTEAATEFQKLLDHHGILFADPVVAMARLQLGRAFVLAGDKTKAKSAYQNFFTFWKNAPGIPILKQAKVEYARL
jgi:eukaryotic-like serine/threonine-protein kinase